MKRYNLSNIKYIAKFEGQPVNLNPPTPEQPENWYQRWKKRGQNFINRMGEKTENFLKVNAPEGSTRRAALEYGKKFWQDHGNKVTPILGAGAALVGQRFLNANNRSWLDKQVWKDGNLIDGITGAPRKLRTRAKIGLGLGALGAGALAFKGLTGGNNNQQYNDRRY